MKDLSDLVLTIVRPLVTYPDQVKLDVVESKFQKKALCKNTTKLNSQRNKVTGYERFKRLSLNNRSSASHLS